VRSPYFASLLFVFCLPSACRADETLNLKLPSPRVESTPAPSSEGSASSRAPSTPDASQNQALDRHTRLRGAPPEKVIGRLGIARRAAPIRAGRSTRKRALTTTPQGTYLALTHDAGKWYGVLMADKSTGWIRKADVELLDYEVVEKDKPQQPQYAGSFPDTGGLLLSGGQQTILDVARNYLGVPYKYGGTAPTGMDCSAFVQRCFAALGINLPRTAHEQINCGMPISPDQLQPADRLYFASRGGRITHTGIYIGNGFFIHSSSSRGGVAVSRLSEPMYRRMFAGARR
jgi:cell wall-associated NlpC family hydrolase